jgi:hypothetical protein
MFTSLEPIFDGSFTRLPTSKELVCPGTFVFVLPPDLNPEAKLLGRIIRSGQNSSSGTIRINLFQPPSTEDNIPSLNLSCLTETVQVVQTTYIVDVHPANIVEVSFVIPYPQLLDDSNMLEVSGMKLVRVLRGRISEGGFKEYFTPSFPSSYDEFHSFYCTFDDVAYRKWVEVVLPIQALLSRLLCRSSLQQGDNFCKKRSEPHQFTSYQWNWMSMFLASHGSPIRNVSLTRRSKRLLVRPTTVSASSIQACCQLIRCETAAQLKAVALLFGNCCLVGLRDAPPSVSNSVLLHKSTCNVIVPSESEEHPFILNTSRLGIDFEHNGAVLKITVRYCKVDGSHNIVKGLFQGRIEAVPLSQLVPVTQDLSAVSVNSFFQLDDGQLAYVTAINANGLCMCTEAQGERPGTVCLPYDFVSNRIRLYRLEQLNNGD